MGSESNDADRVPEDILKYPRFDEQEVVYRWRNDWWDGPIDGSISYRGCRYWFDLYCESNQPGSSNWYYLVFPLSLVEAELADAWSKELESLAAQWAALHNDPNTKNSPAIEDIANRIEAHRKLLPDYSDRKPIGWFTSGSNASFYPVQVVNV